MICPVLPADLICAARVVRAVPPAAARGVARALVVRAARAEAHRRLHGGVHPRWGNGTLAAAARASRVRGVFQGPSAGPAVCDRALARALIHVLNALLASGSLD